jgi:hypothetical protein
VLPVLHCDRVVLRPLDDSDTQRLAEIVAVPGVRDCWGFAGDERRCEET